MADIDWTTVWDTLSGVFLVLGAFLSLAAGVGIMRFPDLLARMHAATKPQVLGLILILIGLELRLRSGAVLLVIVLIALFQMLTSPVAAHMVGRAGYRTGKIRRDLLLIDDLSDDIDAAGVLEARDRLARIAAEAGQAPQDDVVPHITGLRERLDEAQEASEAARSGEPRAGEPQTDEDSPT